MGKKRKRTPPKPAPRRRRRSRASTGAVPSRRRSSGGGSKALHKQLLVEAGGVAAAAGVTEAIERYSDTSTTPNNKSMIQGGGGVAAVAVGVLTKSPTIITLGAHQITAAVTRAQLQPRKKTEGAMGTETGRDLWAANLSGVIDDPEQFIAEMAMETSGPGIAAIIKQIIQQLREGGDVGMEAAIDGALEACGLRRGGSLGDRLRRLRAHRLRSKAASKREVVDAKGDVKDVREQAQDLRRLPAPGRGVDPDTQALLAEIDQLTATY